MEIYRISREKYADKLSASGRANRWNYENEYVVYASSSRSLGALELVVHRNAIMEGLLYKVMVIDVPDEDEIIGSIPPKILTKNWKSLENMAVTQKYGSDWYLNKRSLVLRVPSAIIEQEYNYILNTIHSDFDKISIKHVEDFVWDKRLF